MLSFAQQRVQDAGDTWWVLVASDGLELHPHEQPAKVTVAIAPTVRGGASLARPP